MCCEQAEGWLAERRRRQRDGGTRHSARALAACDALCVASIQAAAAGHSGGGDTASGWVGCAAAFSDQPGLDEIGLRYATIEETATGRDKYLGGDKTSAGQGFTRHYAALLEPLRPLVGVTLLEIGVWYALDAPHPCPLPASFPPLSAPRHVQVRRIARHVVRLPRADRPHHRH